MSMKTKKRKPGNAIAVMIVLSFQSAPRNILYVRDEW